MTQRFYLGAMEEFSGMNTFTLVVESPSVYFVECYNDSRLSFIKERLKTIPSQATGKYRVNGVPLKKLVEAKFQEILGAIALK
jgi:hypothetical protein